MVAQPASAQWPSPTYGCSDVSIEIGGKAYDRPTDDLGLALVRDSITNEVLLNSNQASDANNGTGVEARINFKGRHYGQRWELRTYLADFDNFQTVEGDNLTTPLFPTIDPDRIDTGYESRLFSIELNRKRDFRPGVTLLAGGRFVSLREEFETGFEQLVATPTGSFNLIGSRNIETKNPMIGLQIGAELNKPMTQRTYIHGFIKAGGFLNPTRFTSVTQDNFFGVTDDTTVDKSTGAMLAEVGGKVYHEVVPNCISCFVGYEATWLDGVAVAPAQFLTVGGPLTVQTNNTPFFHAVTFGFKFDY